MGRIGIVCTAVALAIFASPASAQQATPDQPPVEQKEQPSIPPAPPPDRQASPKSPPPFPPMPSRAPRHRFVDMGGHSGRHHSLSSSRRGATMHKHRKSIHTTGNDQSCAPVGHKHKHHQKTCASKAHGKDHATRDRKHIGKDRHNQAKGRHETMRERRRAAADRHDRLKGRHHLAKDRHDSARDRRHQAQDGRRQVKDRHDALRASRRKARDRHDAQKSDSATKDRSRATKSRREAAKDQTTMQRTGTTLQRTSATPRSIATARGRNAAQPTRRKAGAAAVRGPSALTRFPALFAGRRTEFRLAASRPSIGYGRSTGSGGC